MSIMVWTPMVFAASLQSDYGHKEGNINARQKLLRRTELPIYSKEVCNCKHESSVVDSSVFNTVKYVRTECCKVANSVNKIIDRSSKFIFTGIAHTKYNVDVTLDYLHEDRNLLARIGAVGIGALTGYILSLRKGLFKRTIYITSSGLAIAALCYPYEAKVYGKQALLASRRGFIVTYHFCNGVTKDLVGFGLPSLPLRILNPELEGLLKEENSQSKGADSDLYSVHSTKN